MGRSIRVRSVFFSQTYTLALFIVCEDFMEQWKDVLGYEGYYQVSSIGRVRSLTRLDSNGHLLCGKIIKTCPNGRRYLGVILGKNSTRKSYSVHTLVLNTFIGERPNGMECCHNNGNSKDNRACNLRWDSRSNNTKDQIKHGTLYVLNNIKYGEDCGGCKITKKDVGMIRFLKSLKMFRNEDIGNMYSLSKWHVSRIYGRKTWKWF